jgi:hypothetical protein
MNMRVDALDQLAEPRKSGWIGNAGSAEKYD